MKLISLFGLGAVAALSLASTAVQAKEGCGPGFHRVGAYGPCRMNRSLRVGGYYGSQGYWDGHRYWQHRERDAHNGWRYR